VTSYILATSSIGPFIQGDTAFLLTLIYH